MPRLHFDLARMRPVIGVVAGHEDSGGNPKRLVPGNVRPTVGLAPDQLDPRIALRPLLHDFTGAVGTAVVGDDDLQVTPGLRRQGPQGGVDGVLGVVRRNDDRHPRSRGLAGHVSFFLAVEAVVRGPGRAGIQMHG